MNMMCQCKFITYKEVLIIGETLHVCVCGGGGYTEILYTFPTIFLQT